MVSAQTLILCVVICRPLYVFFSFYPCIVFHSSIYGFWLLIWNLQSFQPFVVRRIKPLSTIFQLYRGGHWSTVSHWKEISLTRSYCSLSYIYLCNKCLSSIKVAGSILIMSRCTRHNILVFTILVWVTFTCVRSAYHPLRWRVQFWSCLGALDTTF